MAKIITKEYYCYFGELKGFMPDVRTEDFVVLQTIAERNTFAQRANEFQINWCDFILNNRLEDLTRADDFIVKLTAYDRIPFWKRWLKKKPVPPIFNHELETPGAKTIRWLVRHRVDLTSVDVPIDVYSKVMGINAYNTLRKEYNV